MVVQKKVSAFIDKNKFKEVFPKLFEEHNVKSIIDCDNDEIGRAVRKVLTSLRDYSNDRNIDNLFSRSTYDIYLATTWKELYNKEIQTEAIKRLINKLQDPDSKQEAYEFAQKHKIQQVIDAYAEMER